MKGAGGVSLSGTTRPGLAAGGVTDGLPVTILAGYASGRLPREGDFM